MDIGPPMRHNHTEERRLEHVSCDGISAHIADCVRAMKRDMTSLGVKSLPSVAPPASFYAHVFFDKEYHVEGSQLQRFAWFNPDRQRHLPHARSGGHRVPPAPSRRALKMHKETMSGIRRSPALKPKSATWSGQRTTTSTPNTILDRCPRTQ